MLPRNKCLWSEQEDLLVKKNKKPIYISVAHKINLINAKRIVEQLVKPAERIPEPLPISTAKP
jgi:deoxyinosine 3'endonuclease (endonuclease V)